jgi:hypothetical protein
MFVDGSIDKAAYDDLVAGARADAKNAEDELASVRQSARPKASSLPSIEDVLKAAGSWTNVLAGADVVAQREVLAVLVERIVAVRERQAIYRVEMTWTSLGEALRATIAA